MSGTEFGLSDSHRMVARCELLVVGSGHWMIKSRFSANQ